MGSTGTWKRCKATTVVAVCATAVLLACDPSVRFKYCNNSGRDLAFEAYRFDRKIAEALLPDRESSSYRALMGLDDVHFFGDGEVWMYRDVLPGYPLPSFLIPFCPAKFQVDPDGQMYAVPTWRKLPVASHSRQPRGFPRSPVVEKMNRSAEETAGEK